MMIKSYTAAKLLALALRHSGTSFHVPILQNFDKDYFIIKDDLIKSRYVKVAKIDFDQILKDKIIDLSSVNADTETVYASELKLINDFTNVALYQQPKPTWPVTQLERLLQQVCWVVGLDQVSPADARVSIIGDVVTVEFITATFYKGSIKARFKG